MDKLSPYFIRRNVPNPPEEQEAFVVDDERLETDDETPRFWEYWRVILKWRWLIVALALTGGAGMWLYAYTKTPLYTAQSTLLIERKPSRVVGMSDAFAEPVLDYRVDFYKTQQEILRSAALAAKAIREGGLENDPLLIGRRNGNESRAEKKGLVAQIKDNAKAWLEKALGSVKSQSWLAGIERAMDRIKPAGSGNPKVDPALVKSEFDDRMGTSRALIGRYLGMLSLQPVRQTSLMKVSFTTPHPVLSARLANLHAEAYMRYGMDLRSQANREAMVFLEDKLLELKERVEQSEAALNSYRRQKGIITLDEKGNLVVDRLVDLNQRLTEAEAARISLESEVRLIRHRNYDALPRVRQSGIIASLKNQLGSLEAEYANLAGEFKPGYPPLDTLKLKVEDVRSRLNREIEAEVSAIRSAYRAAENEEDQLRERMEQQKHAALNLKDAAVQYAILAREVDTNRQLYDSVLERMKEMGVAAEVRQSDVSIIDRARPPGGPSYPNMTKSLQMGLLMGLAGGLALAFFFNYLDTTLKTPDEVERYLHLPTLTVVPDFLRSKGKTRGYVPNGANGTNKSLDYAWGLPANGRKHNRDIVLAQHPHSVVAEAYRTLRTALLLSRAGAAPRTILFTSAGLGEGKTTTAINTSVIFAQMGYRVIVIDADLRRSRAHNVLEVPNEVGLSEFLAGQTSREQVTVGTQAENLFFISSGGEPPNPAELVGSRKMKQLLSDLESEYDFIVVDAPPVMPVSDPVFLSTMVDGVVVVVDSQAVPKQLVREVRSRLKSVGANILGVVLNRVNWRSSDYSYHYKHYYSYYNHP